MKLLLIISLAIATLFNATTGPSDVKLKKKTSKTEIPKVLWGSKKSLLRQNKMADADRLRRFKTMAEVKKAVKRGELVKVTSLVIVNKNLVTEGRNYCTPQANRLIKDYARAYKARFKKKPRVTSLVRPLSVQKDLIKKNCNAAKKLTGPRASVHPTGSALDFANRDMSKKEIIWSQKFFVPLETKKKTIEATQEQTKPCFHIFVSKKYKSS